MFERIFGFVRTMAGRVGNLARVGWLWVRSLSGSRPSVEPEHLADKEPLSVDGVPILLGPDDLRPGDILLSSSDAVLGYSDQNTSGIAAFDYASPAWWVRAFDGGWYSHASYFDGTELVEATLDGVKNASVADRVRSQRYVDVFRFHTNNGQPLGVADWPAAPLHAAARVYAKSDYATHDLVFGGVLAFVKGPDLPGVTDDVVRAFLSEAIDVLREFFVEEDREHLTCSELIYRAYDEAEPSPRYRLQLAEGGASWESILPEGFVPMGEPDPTVAEEEPGVSVQIHPDDPLAQEFGELYLSHKSRGHTDETLLHVHAFIGGGGDDEPNPDFVTPRDLAESLSLREMGRLDRAAFSHL